MFLTPSIDEIIQLIKDLSLPEALTYLFAVLKIVDYSKEGYGRIKKVIQDKQNEGKFAFVPNRTEANLLLGFEKQSNFNQLQTLVPNYRYIDLLRTGMLIDYYHKNDSPDNRERVKAIKFQLSKRPNSIKILKIVDLPTTPFFNLIIRYLTELKKLGYAPPLIEENLDLIVEEWAQTTKLVRTEDEVEDIISFCKTQIIKRHSFFCLLGMRSASFKVENALSYLEKEHYLTRHEYEYQLTKSREGNNPRTEIMFWKKNQL